MEVPTAPEATIEEVTETYIDQGVASQHVVMSSEPIEQLANNGSDDATGLSILPVSPFLPVAVSMLHYPFLLDVASMCSLLFTSCHCFESLYGQIGLSHDKTKYPDRESLLISVFVNQTSLQMVTSSMTHCQNFS